MCDCADPLVMDNGMDLIDMMCNCYDSPLDAADDEPQYNFSELPSSFSAAASCTCHFAAARKATPAYVSDVR